jgi:hypothetical protein
MIVDVVIGELVFDISERLDGHFFISFVVQPDAEPTAIDLFKPIINEGNCTLLFI